MSAVADTSSKVQDYKTSTAQKRQQEEQSASKGTLSGNDFMKLLLAQLTNQDPLSPMENMDFTSQLAQLQQLEEQMSMTKAMTSLRTDSQAQSATAMIGKNVTGVDDKGEPVSGTVTRVVLDGENVLVELDDGTRLPVSNVREITSGEGGPANDIASSSNAINMFVEARVDGKDVAGIVQGVYMEDGRVMLKLYGGKAVSWDQVTAMRGVTDSDAWYAYPDDIREKIEQSGEMLKKTVTGKTDSGETVTGIMSDAELVDGEVYIVLYGGERMKLENVTSTPRDPTAEEAEQHLGGKWAVGLDEDGNAIEGQISGAEVRDGDLVLLLSDGRHLYYDSTPVIRTPTEEDLAKLPPAVDPEE